MLELILSNESDSWTRERDLLKASDLMQVESSAVCPALRRSLLCAFYICV